MSDLLLGRVELPIPRQSYVHKPERTEHETWGIWFPDLREGHDGGRWFMIGEPGAYRVLACGSKEEAAANLHNFGVQDIAHPRRIGDNGLPVTE